MKNFIKKVGITTFLFLNTALATTAQVTQPNPPTSPITDINGVKTWLINVTKWGFTFFFILAVAFILLAAYRFLMAKDNQTEVQKAITSLKNAAIAIAIALVSAGVSSIINSVLKLGQ